MEPERWFPIAPTVVPILSPCLFPFLLIQIFIRWSTEYKGVAMFGFDPDEITIEPVEIDGTVYVPVHTVTEQLESSTFIDYETIMEQHGLNDSLGTDEFRFDGN